MAKRYRDAVTGEFITKEEAMAKKNESVAETVKPRKGSSRKKIPESGTSTEATVVEESEFMPDGKRNPKFKMKMDVVFRGKVYLRKNIVNKQLPTEAQNYLASKGWSE